MKGLILIVLIAAFFRFDRIDWDERTHNHPDERFLSQVLDKISLPKNFTEYLNTDASPLNPGNLGYNNYVYGTLPLFLVKFTAHALGYDSFESAYLVGRTLSAIFDTGSVVLLYASGTLLFSSGVGLIAGFFLACTVLNIQHAHFFVVDPYLVFFSLLSFYFFCRILKRNSLGDYFFSGISLGAALSCKITAVFFLLGVPLSALLSHLAIDDVRKKSHERALIGIFISSVAAFLVFRIFQPYAFRPFSLHFDGRFIEALSEQRSLSMQPSLFPPSLQWIGRAWWYPIQNMVMWGMGPALGILAVMAWIIGAYEVLNRKSCVLILPLALSAIVVGFHAASFVKVMRYLLPAYPILILLAARLSIRLGPAVSCIVGLCTLSWALAFTSIYRAPFVRSEASAWIRKEISPDTPIAIEHWDDPLPVRRSGDGPRYTSRRAMKVFDQDTPEKRSALVKDILKSEYIFLNSSRGYGAIPRNPALFPVTTLYYTRLFDGGLGFDLVREFHSFPQLFGVEIPTVFADESFFVYDHPRILVFQKKRTLSKIEISALITPKTTLPGGDSLIRKSVELSKKLHG